MKIKSLDHLVLTVASIKATVSFYEKIGMNAVTFLEGRRALRFGSQKINLHQRGMEFEPKARHPQPGSADLCFLVEEPIDAVVDALKAQSIAIVSGPVERTGAVGRLRSIYITDPDGNLIELSNLC